MRLVEPSASLCPFLSIKQFLFTPKRNNLPVLNHQIMLEKADESHEHAAMHHTEPAKHHTEAAKHQEADHYEKVALYAQTVAAHANYATEHATHGSKAHAEEYEKE